MLRVLRISVLASVCVVTAPVLLATEPGPKDMDNAHTRSQDAVEQARRLSRDTEFNLKIRRDGNRALSAAAEANRDAVPAVDTTHFPNIDPETLAKAQEDLKVLLADPRLTEPQGSPADDDDPRPLVFISFSMPEASLRSLLAEAARTGSPLVLRGLVEGSMKRTVARLGELLGTGEAGNVAEPAPEHGREAEVRATGAERPDSTAVGTGALRPSPHLTFGPASRPLPSLAIDPTLFERFGVDKVPAFVLPLDALAPCTPDGCAVPAHLKVAGDVSLAYALSFMAREAGGTAWGSRAEEWRQRLEAQ